MDWLQWVAKEYGLFVCAVVYIIWDGRQRESKYILVIDRLSDEIKKDIDWIKNRLDGGRNVD